MSAHLHCWRSGAQSIVLRLEKLEVHDGELEASRLAHHSRSLQSDRIMHERSQPRPATKARLNGAIARKLACWRASAMNLNFASHFIIAVISISLIECS